MAINPRFDWKKYKKVDEIGEQMKALASNVLAFSPITRDKDADGHNWLYDLKDQQKFITGSSGDIFLEQYKVLEHNEDHLSVLLLEISVEGKLDLSTPTWVNSELFSNRYKLQGLIND